MLLHLNGGADLRWWVAQHTQRILGHAPPAFFWCILTQIPLIETRRLHKTCKLVICMSHWKMYTVWHVLVHIYYKSNVIAGASLSINKDEIGKQTQVFPQRMFSFHVWSWGLHSIPIGTYMCMYTSGGSRGEAIPPPFSPAQFSVVSQPQYIYNGGGYFTERSGTVCPKNTWQCANKPRSEMHTANHPGISGNIPENRGVSRYPGKMLWNSGFLG